MYSSVSCKISRRELIKNLPQKAQAVKDSLEKKGFQKSTKKGRDHEFFFFYHNGKKTNIFTKISYGEREIHDHNCSNMARQIKLSNPQFKEFVDCPLELKDYVQLLIQGKHILQSASPSATSSKGKSPSP